jgi:deoxyadenosine/deoxycytidine kinase
MKHWLTSETPLPRIILSADTDKRDRRIENRIGPVEQVLDRRSNNMVRQDT